MEIEAQRATIDMVRRQADGRMVSIEADVLNVAADLHDIDPSLRLRVSDAQGHFVVYRLVDRGPDVEPDEDLVTTAMECDQRLVNTVRKLYAPGYDMVAELHRVEAQQARDAEHAEHERIGPAAEQMSHALLKDLGVKTQMYVPAGVEKALERETP